MGREEVDIASIYSPIPSCPVLSCLFRHVLEGQHPPNLSFECWMSAFGGEDSWSALHWIYMKHEGMKLSNNLPYLRTANSFLNPHYQTPKPRSTPPPTRSSQSCNPPTNDLDILAPATTFVLTGLWYHRAIAMPAW
jgi:hypothetical protein